MSTLPKVVIDIVNNHKAELEERRHLCIAKRDELDKAIEDIKDQIATVVDTLIQTNRELEALPDFEAKVYAMYQIQLSLSQQAPTYTMPQTPVPTPTTALHKPQINSPKQMPIKLPETLYATWNVLNTMDEPLTVAKLADLMDENIVTINNRLMRLRERGVVTRSNEAPDGFVGKPPYVYSVIPETVARITRS